MINVRAAKTASGNLIDLLSRDPELACDGDCTKVVEQRVDGDRTHARSTRVEVGGKGADLSCKQCDSQRSTELLCPAGRPVDSGLVQAIPAVHQNSAHVQRRKTARCESGN